MFIIAVATNSIFKIKQTRSSNGRNVKRQFWIEEKAFSNKRQYVYYVVELVKIRLCAEHDSKELQIAYQVELFTGRLLRIRTGF